MDLFVDQSSFVSFQLWLSDRHEFLTEPFGSDSTCHKILLRLVKESLGPVGISPVDQLHLPASHRGAIDPEPQLLAVLFLGLGFLKAYICVTEFSS